MNQKVRVRFAPSPTGHLHIGGARTALYNYLYAKSQGGTFLLRIEDTDLERSEEQYTDAILKGMSWLGMQADEEPCLQSQRTEVYLRYLKKLEEIGGAYRCYCTSEEIETMREKARAQGLKPKYNGKCRHLTTPPTDKDFCLRFKAKESGSTIVHDLIKGQVEFPNEELDDFIIARTDGSPTYQFVVVVDDAEMQITHVIRGDDHLNNTPKQIQLYEAFGFDLPQFAHIPMILGADKKRLSKRHGATSVMAYHEAGYLPEAIVNYLVRLGWSHGDQEIFTQSELETIFDIKNVGKSAAVFNPEKLLWLNQHYLKSLTPQDLLNRSQEFLDQHGIQNLDNEYTQNALKLFQDKAKDLNELVESARFFFEAPKQYDETATQKFLDNPGKNHLSSFKERLSDVEEFSVDHLALLLKNFAAELNIKFPLIAQPLRIALTGSTQSPSIDLTMAQLGKTEVLKRIETCLKSL